MRRWRKPNRLPEIQILPKFDRSSLKGRENSNCGRFVCSSRYLQYANERQQVQQSRKYKRHQSLKGKTKTFYYNNENILVLTVSLGPLTVGESLHCALNFVHFFFFEIFFIVLSYMPWHLTNKRTRELQSRERHFKYNGFFSRKGKE